MANPDLMTGLGAALSIFLSSTGATVASVEAGIFALRTGGSLMAFLPIVISGVLAIYGIIIATILCGQTNVSEQEGYQNFSAGLCVGLGKNYCTRFLCLSCALRSQSFFSFLRVLHSFSSQQLA